MAKGRMDYDTGAEDSLTTAESTAPTDKKMVRIRALRPAFRRNGRTFTSKGETFDANELRWTPEQWKAARADGMLVIEDVKE